jgi:ABC-2 type transport system permease protein
MPVSQWLSLAVVLIAGALPFVALALAIGYFASATAAPAIVNTIYMPMCFLSGLWIPIQALPPALQNIAPALPGYHIGQIGLRVIDMPVASAWTTNVVVLSGFTLLFGVFAYIGHWREKRSL